MAGQQEHISRRRFLGVGAAAGLAAASSSLMASSCGKELPEAGGKEAIVKDDELKPNSALVYADANSGEPRVLVRLQSGEYALYSAKCTHQGCTVAYRPEGEALACPCHNSTYDAKNGDVFNGPAKKPLPKLAVRVEGGKVFSA